MICPNCGQELPAGSKFCQYCGEKLTTAKGQFPEQNSFKETHKEKKSKTYAIIASLVLIIGLVTLLIPNFKKQAEYSRLYAQAKKEIGDGNYTQAIYTFDELLLLKPNYKDAKNLRSSAITMEADRILSMEDRAKDVRALLYISKYKDENDELNNKYKAIQTEVYNDGVAKYRDKLYHEAYYDFEKIPGVDNSSSYITLLRIILNDKQAIFEHVYDLSEFEFSQLTLQMINNIDFENTKEVLLSYIRTAELFLQGEWRTEDGKLFLTVDRKANNIWSFNLPCFSKSSDITLSNGIYSIKGNNANRDQFCITIVDENEITVYCYKDGITYTLYRKTPLQVW